MSVIYMGVSSGAAILSCFFVHLFYTRLMRDPTNIEFSTSFLIALVTGIVLHFGIPIINWQSPLTAFGVFLLAILIAWKLSYWLTVLTGLQSLLLSLAANLSYTTLFYAAWFTWLKLTGYAEV